MKTESPHSPVDLDENWYQSQELLQEKALQEQAASLGIHTQWHDWVFMLSHGRSSLLPDGAERF